MNLSLGRFAGSVIIIECSKFLNVCFIAANVEALAMWRHSLNVQPIAAAE
jgi:hypothetical protein